MMQTDQCGLCIHVNDADWLWFISGTNANWLNDLSMQIVQTDSVWFISVSNADWLSVVRQCKQRPYIIRDVNYIHWVFKRM